MRFTRSTIGVVAGVALLGAGAFAFERSAESQPDVQVMLGQSDGLPDVLKSEREYFAFFTVEWEGDIDLHDSLVSIFASRRGPTSDDAPPDGWPVVCDREIDSADGRVQLSCPIETPGPGEFALQLQVETQDGDLIAEGLYTHIIE